MSGLANPLAPRRNLPARTATIKAWVRELCELDDDVILSVTELACRDDGCPDIETVIGIMRPAAKTEMIRIHRPIAEVMRDNVEDAISDKTSR